MAKAIAVRQTSGSFSTEFDIFASQARLALDDGAKAEVCQRLAQGVYYIYGMGVQGDIAEFGTMTGKTAVALAAALAECSRTLTYSDRAHGYNEERQLYLFDSFEGLPESKCDEDTISPHVKSGVWDRGSCKGLTSEQLLGLCSRFLDSSRIHVVQGWFKDTVSHSLNQKVALAHVDGDLYESAIDSLDPLFKKGLIAEGAIIFFDDWNCNRADPLYGERKAWSDLVTKYNVRFSDEGSYGIAGHRFIVHGYTS